MLITWSGTVLSCTSWDQTEFRPDSSAELNNRYAPLFDHLINSRSFGVCMSCAWIQQSHNWQAEPISVGPLVRIGWGISNLKEKDRHLDPIKKMSNAMSVPGAKRLCQPKNSKMIIPSTSSYRFHQFRMIPQRGFAEKWFVKRLFKSHTMATVE